MIYILMGGAFALLLAILIFALLAAIFIYLFQTNITTLNDNEYANKIFIDGPDSLKKETDA